MKLKSIDTKGDGLTKLVALAQILAKAIDECADSKTLPQLAKQYRETVKEIEFLKGLEPDDDDIGQLLAEREAEGKAGAVR